MLLSTPGHVLHTTPYGESSVVAKVFTRQLGLQSYIIKGVRGPRGHVKQNLLQPLSCLDMVVYNNPRNELNHVRELSARHPVPPPDPVGNALRFFMTEVLYKTLREDEPMPTLWDYVESEATTSQSAESGARKDVPIRFMLTVAHHLGIEPLDNHSSREPYFSLQGGSFVGVSDETSLSLHLSMLMHQYLDPTAPPPDASQQQRAALLDALIAYYQLHLSGFHNFHSHEILHTILR